MTLTNKDNLPPVRRACGHCGRLGHLRTTCTFPARTVDKIGVEIEGYWRDLDAAKRLARNLGANAGLRDGSLSTSVDGCEAWEFPTAPGTLGEVLKVVRDLYPDATDSQAGMHVHVSFLHPLCITSLCTEEFFEYFRASWREWGLRFGIARSSQFWHRLEGSNQYCRQNSETDLRRGSIINDDRYRQLNFRAWSEHRTVECRMLPLFRDLKIALAAIEHLVEIFEVWLSPDGPACDIATLAPEATTSVITDAIVATVVPPTVLTAELPSELLTVPSAIVEALPLPELATEYPPVAPGMRRIAGRRAFQAEMRAAGLL